jgi:hypothetical protein
MQFLIYPSSHLLIHSLSCSICGFFYSALCLLFCVICPPSSVFCLLTSVSFTVFRFYSILLNIYYIIPRVHSQVNSGKNFGDSPNHDCVKPLRRSLSLQLCSGQALSVAEWTQSRLCRSMPATKKYHREYGDVDLRDYYCITTEFGRCHSRASGNPGCQTYFWIPAFAGMTILDIYKFTCYEVLNCGVKYGLIILQPPRSYSARPAAALYFCPWHFSKISSKSASQMAPSRPLIDSTDKGKVFSVRKPARAILRLLDASTHQKPAILGASVRRSGRLMAGGTGPGNLCSTLIILSLRACEAVAQFQCGRFLWPGTEAFCHPSLWCSHLPRG